MTNSLPEATTMTGHDLLLRLAGRIPDQALAEARLMLAVGTVSAAITFVADLVTHSPVPIPITADELAAIRELSGDAGALAEVRPAAELPALRFGFGQLDGNAQARRDEIDEALVAAAQAHAQALSGIWRTWRYRMPDAALAQDAQDAPQLYRVYIVQVEDRDAIQMLAADLLGAITDPASTGIEIITLGAEPPPYQRAALDESLLLWATVAAPEFEVARVFDFADPVAGPGFAPDHAVIDDQAERDRLLAYLRAGHPILMTTAGMTDILDPAAGAVVPTSFRTDGDWIWTDTVVYYLSRHSLAPDARLRAHIETQLTHGVLTPDVDQDTASQAASFMLHPPATKTRAAVWFPG
jgi:hypothetical protein